MRPFDGNAAELLLQFGGAAGVVEVAMREQDLLGRHARLLDAGLDALEIAAGIDHGAPLGRLVPQQRAVLLERRDGNDGGFERHGELVSRGCGGAVLVHGTRGARTAEACSTGFPSRRVEDTPPA